MRTGDFAFSRQSGAIFLWALAFVFVLALAMGKLLEMLSTRNQRFLEEDLLWTGEQYRLAIKSYYLASPGSVKQLPLTVDDLLEDPRLLTLTRHLRKAYLDPMTQQKFDEIHDASGSLIGVRSRSAAAPFKTMNFPLSYAQFSHATSYQEWEFIFLP